MTETHETVRYIPSRRSEWSKLWLRGDPAPEWANNYSVREHSSNLVEPWEEIQVQGSEEEEYDVPIGCLEQCISSRKKSRHSSWQRSSSSVAEAPTSEKMVVGVDKSKNESPRPEETTDGVEVVEK